MDGDFRCRILYLKSHDLLIRWSSKITRVSKVIISHSLPKCLLPLNLAGWWLTLEDSYPCSHMILYLRGLIISFDKQKALDLYCRKIYCSQTWHDGVIQWRGPVHKVTWYFYHAILSDRVKNFLSAWPCKIFFEIFLPQPSERWSYFQLNTKITCFKHNIHDIFYHDLKANVYGQGYSENYCRLLPE